MAATGPTLSHPRRALDQRQVASLNFTLPPAGGSARRAGEVANLSLHPPACGPPAGGSALRAGEVASLSVHPPACGRVSPQGWGGQKQTTVASWSGNSRELVERFASIRACSNGSPLWFRPGRLRVTAHTLVRAANHHLGSVKGEYPLKLELMLIADHAFRSNSRLFYRLWSNRYAARAYNVPRTPTPCPPRDAAGPRFNS